MKHVGWERYVKVTKRISCWNKSEVFATFFLYDIISNRPCQTVSVKSLEPF